MALTRDCFGLFRRQPVAMPRIASIDPQELQRILQNCKDRADKETVLNEVQICLRFLKEIKEKTPSYVAYKSAASTYTNIYRLMLLMLSVGSVAALFELSVYLGVYQLCLELFNIQPTSSPKTLEVSKKIKALSKEISDDLAGMDEILGMEKLDIHFDIPKKDARAFVHAVVDRFGPRALIDSEDGKYGVYYTKERADALLADKEELKFAVDTLANRSGPAAVFPGWIYKCLEGVGPDGMRYSLQELSGHQYSQEITYKFVGHTISFDAMRPINARDPCFLINYNITHPIEECSLFSQLCEPFRKHIYPSLIHYKVKLDDWIGSLKDRNQKIIFKQQELYALKEEEHGYSGTILSNNFFFAFAGSVVAGIGVVLGLGYVNSLLHTAKNAHEIEMRSLNSLQHLQGLKKGTIFNLCSKLGLKAESCSIKALESILEQCVEAIQAQPAIMQPSTTRR